MKIGQRISGWLGRLRGIKASDDFVSVDEVRQARGGLGKVGQGLDANVVMAPVQFIQRTFTQSVPIVEERAEGRKWKPLDEHPLEDLLADPNPFYDGDTLAKAFLLSWFLDGNAYLLKARNQLRGVAHLWYVPHWLIEPVWPRLGGGGFITHYDYDPDGMGKQRLAVEEVVHLRVGLDPRNPRKGLSPIKAALREVLTDEEASAFSAHLLGNMGVPGGVIAPKDVDVPMSPDDVEELIAAVRASDLVPGLAVPPRGHRLVAPDVGIPGCAHDPDAAPWRSGDRGQDHVVGVELWSLSALPSLAAPAQHQRS